MVENNKKALAEKLKNHLNTPEYVAVPDLIKSSDYGPDLSCHNEDEDVVLKRRKFIDWKEHPKLINYNDLEPTDWKEIISLIKQRNEEWEQNYQAKKKKIADKVNSQPGLYYYYGSGSKDDRWTSSFSYGDKQGRYFGLWGSENGRSFYLDINSKHPVLNNFPFGKHGYYLIETDKPIERNDGVVRPWGDGGETNPNNFRKWVEVGDKITITPYQVENDSELSKKEKAELGLIKDCDICQKNENEMDNGTEKWYNLRRYHGQKSEILHACSNCYKKKEQEYLQNYEFIFTFPTKDLTHEGITFLLETIKGGKTDCYAGKKDQNGKILQQQNCPHCQPWKHQEVPNPDEKKIINLLLQFFHKYYIKKIKLVNGELVIEYDSKENKKEASNSQELQLARKIIQKTNNQELTREALNNMINNNSSASTEKPKNNNDLWIGCGIAGVVIIGITIGLLMRKNKNKKN